MAHVLITGGSGFLGSHLSDAFLERGDRVTAVDNFLTGSPDNVAHLASEDRFTLVEHDVTEGIPVEGDVDVVLHFASPASPVHYYAHPIKTLRAGSIGTENALQLAREHGARFLMASTSEVYGDPERCPQPETYWGHVNSIGPRSCYDEAKRYGEAVTMAYHRQYDVDTRIVRFFNTYGPRMALDDGRVLPAFIAAAERGEALSVHGSGTQTRSFSYVADSVAGVLAVLEDGDHMPYNVGATGEMSILDFARLVLEVMDRDVPIRHTEAWQDDPKRREPDLARLRGLGWTPQVGLREGLERTVSWFRDRYALETA